MQLFSSYSFQDVYASLVGPTGAFSLGNGAGVGEGGISVELMEDKDTMVIGADGGGMHSLHAGQGGTITVRLLKVSATNLLLSASYDAQSITSALWGLNTIVITNIVNGDVVTCMQCAFKRQPSNTWSKDANIVEWQFNSTWIFEVLGAGLGVVQI